MSQGRAFAKINLALVVGPQRADGKHEVVTVLQRIDLHDKIEVEPADALVVDGFADGVPSAATSRIRARGLRA